MISIVQETSDEFEHIIRMAERMFQEAGETSKNVRVNELLEMLNKYQGKFTVFSAIDDGDKCVGMLTLIESFAFFANGTYGVINELFVIPEYRDKDIERQLIEFTIEYGKLKKWSYLTAVAPKSISHFFHPEETGFSQNHIFLIKKIGATEI